MPSVQHKQQIGGNICLTTMEKKETFDLQVRNWRDIAACAEHCMPVPLTSSSTCCNNYGIKGESWLYFSWLWEI